MSEKLKKCPFCGGTPTFCGWVTGYQILCNRCNAGTSIYIRKDGCIKRWNTRKEEPKDE